MPKKTASLKNRIWERDRRNRFNESFNELASLLPKHNSKNNLSKACIIQKSKEFIIQLQKNVAILEEYKDSTPKLRLELALLAKKCDLLMNILEQNGLTIPADCVDISTTDSNILKEQQNVKTVKTKKIDLDIRNKSIKSKDCGNEIIKIPKDNEQVFQSNSDEIRLKEKNELKNNNSKDDMSTIIASKDCKQNANKAKIKDPQIENSKSHNADDGFPSVISPVLIVTNDPPIVSQCTILFNTTQASNGMMLTKTSIQPNILVIKNSSHNIGIPCKKSVHHKNYKKKQQGNGMKKIASKGFSLDFTKTMILNKLPIPALTKKFLSKNSDISIPLKSESDIKINSLKRVSYRVLRRTKILNKNVQLKNKQTKIKNNKIIDKENRTQGKGMVDLNSSILVKNKMELKDKSIEGNKIQTTNHILPTTSESLEVINKTAITSVTYSIDSICSINSKTNDPVLNATRSSNAQIKLEDKGPRQQNLQKESLIKVKKNLVIPCIDNNSKNDPLSDLSNDLFASLQVAPISNHSVGCTSPTAAFLLAFPLVSTLNGGKVNQVMIDDNSEIQDQNTALLQIDNQKSEAQTNLMNLEQFSTLFASKEMYNSCEHKQSMTQKDEIINTSMIKDKTIDINNKTLSLKSSIKPNSECLFTYSHTESISCTPTIHNLYNSNFEQNNKNEKNKFSHTNLVLDNTTTSGLDNPQNSYNEHINMTSQDLHQKFHTDFNQIKALSDHPTCSISMQNDTPLLMAYSANKTTPSETYHSYAPFYGSAVSKDTTRCLSTTAPTITMPNLYNTKLLVHNPHKADSIMQDYNIFENKVINNSNNETSNEEKMKIQNDLVGQELKYQKIGETRYKPYESNISIKCKQNYARENMRDCQNLMKAPVNWMTSPDVRPTASTLPKFNKNYIQNLPINNFNFNNIDSDAQDSRKESFFIIPPSNTMDDSLNTWVSSIKMQESQSQLNLPTTLPTLIGDLALGTTTPLLYGQDNFKSNPACYSDKKESIITMHKEEIYTSNEKNCLKNDETHRTPNSWNNSFLSVSQLVDQFKSEKDTMIIPGDRYNGSSLKPDTARSDEKNLLDNSKRNLRQTDIGNISDVFEETDRCKNKQDNVTNHHNSITKGHKKHSAEALLSTKQANNKSFYRQQQFFPLVDFTIDIQQDIMKEKQHSKHSNVYSIANANYSYPNVMLGTNHVIGSEQNLENKLQQLSNDNNLQPIPHQSNVHKGNFYKTFGQNIPNGNKNDSTSSAQCPKRLCTKTSHKYHENSGNSMFDSNYLSAPKHSPIFSEESFYNYSSGYNPNSTTGYQNTNSLHNTNSRCHVNQQVLPFSSQIANPVLSKTINNIPISSPNTTNNSSSLTNFNLSTIFPEINDKIRSHW